MLVLVPAFSAHPDATNLDLDQFAVRGPLPSSFPYTLPVRPLTSKFKSSRTSQSNT